MIATFNTFDLADSFEVFAGLTGFAETVGAVSELLSF
jgi:hypothetical protein